MSENEFASRAIIDAINSGHAAEIADAISLAINAGERWAARYGWYHLGLMLKTTGITLSYPTGNSSFSLEDDAKTTQERAELALDTHR